MSFFVSSCRQKKSYNTELIEKFDAPPLYFPFSVLQEREKNGLRLSLFLQPRISRTHFGIGFQDLAWNFYENDVQSTPSRTIKIVFKNATNIPQPGLL